MKQQIQELIDRLKSEINFGKIDYDLKIHTNTQESWSQASKIEVSVSTKMRLVSDLQSILSSSQPEKGVKAWAVKDDTGIYAEYVGEYPEELQRIVEGVIEDDLTLFPDGYDIVPVIIIEIKD
jgi:hypothetical protein